MSVTDAQDRALDELISGPYVAHIAAYPHPAAGVPGLYIIEVFRRAPDRPARVALMSVHRLHHDGRLEPPFNPTTEGA